MAFTESAELCYTLSILYGDNELTDENITSEVSEYSPQPSAEELSLLLELSQHELWNEEEGDTVEQTFNSIRN